MQDLDFFSNVRKVHSDFWPLALSKTCKICDNPMGYFGAHFQLISSSFGAQKKCGHLKKRPHFDHINVVKMWSFYFSGSFGAHFGLIWGSRKCGQNVVIMWSKCGLFFRHENLTKMWSKCGQNVVIMWSKCGQNVVFS